MWPLAPLGAHRPLQPPQRAGRTGRTSAERGIASLRYSSAASIGSCSSELGENEMPQKSVDPGADPIFDDIKRPSLVKRLPEARPDGDRPVALALHRQRLQRPLGGLRSAAPARPIDRERHELLRLWASFEHDADRHEGPPPGRLRLPRRSGRHEPAAGPAPRHHRHERANAGQVLRDDMEPLDQHIPRPSAVRQVGGNLTDRYVIPVSASIDRRIR